MTATTRGRLWAGLVLAPAAWVCGELGGYYLAARSCDPSRGVPLAGTTHPAMTNLVIEGVAFLVGATGLWIASTNWRATRADAPSAEAARGRAHFMAFTGIVVSSLFLLGIVLFGLSSFVVNACGQAS